MYHGKHYKLEIHQYIPTTKHYSGSIQLIINNNENTMNGYSMN